MFRIVGLSEPVTCFNTKDVQNTLQAERNTHVAIQWSSLSGIKNVKWVTIDQWGDIFHTYKEGERFDFQNDLPPASKMMASW